VLGFTHDLNTGCFEALVFGREIPDLNPESEVASGRPVADTGEF
jgi:hypothetical protein